MGSQGGIQALGEVDVTTGNFTPLGALQPEIGAVSSDGVALDLQNQRYTCMAISSDGAGIRLYGMETGSGAMIFDPLVTWPLYSELMVAYGTTPLRGTVTPQPHNELAPGSSLTLLFQAPGHGGEFYLPFVSCTPGLTLVPSSNLEIPLAWDACTTFFFSDPAAPTVFSLTPGSARTGVLSPLAGAQGTLSLPQAPPIGWDLDLHVTFLTISPAMVFTGRHGQAVVHLHL